MRYEVFTTPEAEGDLKRLPAGVPVRPVHFSRRTPLKWPPVVFTSMIRPVLVSRFACSPLGSTKSVAPLTGPRRYP